MTEKLFVVHKKERADMNLLGSFLKLMMEKKMSGLVSELCKLIQMSFLIKRIRHKKININNAVTSLTLKVGF